MRRNRGSQNLAWDLRMGWQVSRNPSESFSCGHLADQSVHFSSATCCLDSSENKVPVFERIFGTDLFPTHP